MSRKRAEVVGTAIRQVRDIGLTLADGSFQRGNLAGDELTAIGDDLGVECPRIRQRLLDGAR